MGGNPPLRVALVADVRGWAFDGIAQAIQKYNPDPSLEIDIFYQRELGDPRASLYHYDLLWPFELFQARFLRRHGFTDFIVTIHALPFSARLSSISSYASRLREAGEMAQRVSVLNNKLFALWEKLHRHVYRTTVGIDTAIFSPNGRGVSPRGKLRVAWIGNSEKPYKRFDLVRAATDIPGVELDAIDWSPGRPGLIPHKQIGDFYKAHDVLLCLSDHEGLPTPLLEASACGVPTIVTPVGVTDEFIEDGVNGFVVSQDIAEVQERLAYLRDNPEARRKIGNAACASVQRWTWPKVISQWVNFVNGI